MLNRPSLKHTVNYVLNICVDIGIYIRIIYSSTLIYCRCARPQVGTRWMGLLRLEKGHPHSGPM
jgi:hypothetical protein